MLEPTKHPCLECMRQTAGNVFINVATYPSPIDDCMTESYMFYLVKASRTQNFYDRKQETCFDDTIHGWTRHLSNSFGYVKVTICNIIPGNSWSPPINRELYDCCDSGVIWMEGFSKNPLESLIRPNRRSTSDYFLYSCW